MTGHQTNRMVETGSQKGGGVVLFVGEDFRGGEVMIGHLDEIRRMEIADHEKPVILEQPVRLRHAPEQVRSVDPVKDKVYNDQIERLSQRNRARRAAHKVDGRKARLAIQHRLQRQLDRHDASPAPLMDLG